MLLLLTVCAPVCISQCAFLPHTKVTTHVKRIRCQCSLSKCIKFSVDSNEMHSRAPGLSISELLMPLMRHRNGYGAPFKPLLISVKDCTTRQPICVRWEK
ncbi:hypothetical protein, unlikely [Trypanosoma congolense IL3000]|uniref:Secreted protein n=1 Tax=Trypanosoma congolense (strain IL3000) TaxID=1068625 RepID=F9WG80_TRYCI|nr:hypothetical protein, unlikely [Trypanosoma congolense IL3000]